MEEHVSLGYWIRRRRKALDLTQDALAAQISCSVTTIHKLEADERRPSRQMAELLADALAIAPQDRPRFLQIARAERSSAHLAALAPVATERPLPTLAVSTPAPPQPKLPASTTPLVGRSLELEQIATLLHEPTCRLLTLVGPGGMGKTRLALAIAESWAALVAGASPVADGIWFVALAAIGEPEFLVSSIAKALGLALSSGSEPIAQLLDHLREKRLLLVLDNFEHLLAGAELVTDMLQAAPALKVLVTSRERLNLQGEWVFEVQGLPVPAREQSAHLEEYSAVTLFVQSAQRVRSGFALSEKNRQHVVQICRLVEGMPLGIELAAAWVHLLSCQEVAQEIERTIDFLAVNRRDVPPRHRSLRAAFDHSWQLLSEEERRVLRQLAVFQGGFTRTAAEHVAKATLPLLAALVTKSLLRRTPGPSERVRYELHELVRQYAYAWLRTADEESLTRTRHLAYFQQLAEQAYRPLLTAEQPSWLSQLEAEHSNVRAALEWSLRDEKNTALISAGLHLAGTLWLFWWLGDHWREGSTWLRRLLAVEVEREQEADWGAYQRARARATYGAATLALDQYDVQQALIFAEESLPLCRAVGDQWGVAFSLFLRSVLGLTEVGDAQQANTFAQESVNLFRQMDDKRGLSLPLETLGHLARRRGDYKAAVALWQQALSLNRAAGDPTGIAQSSDLLAKAWIRQGEYAQAQRLLEESLVVYRQLGNRFGAAYALLHLGRIAHTQRDYAQAKQCYTESQTIFQGLGSKDPNPLFHRGRLALDEGKVAEAQGLLAASLALAQEVGFAEYIVPVQITLAMTLFAQEAYVAAGELLAESLSRAEALHDKDALAQAFYGAAQLALVQKEAPRAAQLLGMAQGLWQALDLPPPPEMRLGYEHCLDGVRSQMDQASLQAAYAEGQAMTLEQAIACARDLITQDPKARR